MAKLKFRYRCVACKARFPSQPSVKTHQRQTRRSSACNNLTHHHNDSDSNYAEFISSGGSTSYKSSSNNPHSHTSKSPTPSSSNSHESDSESPHYSIPHQYEHLPLFRDDDIAASDSEDLDYEADIDEAFQAALEHGWEADRQETAGGTPPSQFNEDFGFNHPGNQAEPGGDSDDGDDEEEHTKLPQPNKVVVDYPNPHAGAPIEPPGDVEPPDANGRENPWAPFSCRMDWEIARWAKLRGAGSTAFSDLLAIPGVAERLNLLYNNSRELNKIINEDLASRHPKFQRHEVIIKGEAHEVYYRNIIGCIRALWADKDLSSSLVFQPVKEFEDDGCSSRIYSDMHTAKWWWETQVSVDANTEGRTIVPVLISSDWTTLTTFGGKSALSHLYDYREHTKIHLQETHVPTSSHRRTLSNLFHFCVDLILEPLKAVGENGTPMRGADGIWRRCHPIFAMFVGDYPEQTLVACVKKGECPICIAPASQLGSLIHHAAYRNITRVRNALKTLPNGATLYCQSCTAAGIKPVQHPFWEHLPYSNIYHSITPDILHQLYQGLVKHLVAWLQVIYGDAEIDARCRRLPPNHHVRLFLKGLSPLSRVTGKEHLQIMRILLGLVIGAKPLCPHTPEQVRNIIRSVRSLIDFVMLAQYPIHTRSTLNDLCDALSDFHAPKKVFIQLGVQADWMIPKLHMLEHYADMIQFYGTTDNYNTEYTERLHIDMVKEAYQSTNMKDEFPQMTLWLERREKIFQHDETIRWCLQNSTIYNPPPPTITSLLRPAWHLTMTKWPTVRRVSVETLVMNYGAVDFIPSLSRFITSRQQPQLSWRQVEAEAWRITIDDDDFDFPVYHYLKFAIDEGLTSQTVDILHTKPAREDKHGNILPAPSFDPALVPSSRGRGLKAYQVVQIRAIFTLPQALIQEYFNDDPDFRDSANTSDSPMQSNPSPPIHLAYVELFTKFEAPDPITGLFRIKQLLHDNGHHQVARIIPVSQIKHSIHLFPKFGTQADPNWTSSNVLDRSSEFFVNEISDRKLYVLMHDNW
ncbi:hypothetical protein BDN72DRAFT_905430 [Pluteus cervinus]|uniref:Uncharacterized protein n=1 Tax=Pluteus cervinus TaxID=181527 RepID=A0ACD3A2T8_9AGAR|nr:hypothetical protein BDN72DRAFT_905430 [Pluteus cervinus]